MSTSLQPKDEWRARQAVSKDEFVTSNPIYRGLLEQIHQPSSSPAECAKFYVDHTVSLAANTDSRHDLDHFIEVFSGSILELGARTHYRDESIRFKLVEFVHEMQKTVIKDPKSDSGEQLHYSDNPKSVLWKDLPDYWLACAEERISFVSTDPTNTFWEMERWRNLSAFWAGQTRFASTDHASYALEAFREAFGPHEPDDEAGNRDFLLQTACIWMIYGIGWIWPRVQVEAELWERERWEQWKQGLKDSRDVDNEDETRDLVEEALSAMERADQGQHV